MKTNRNPAGSHGSAGAAQGAVAGMQDATRLLERNGFVFAGASLTVPALAAAGLAHWDDFARSWDELGLDTYMADEGRYRRRRFAAFAISAAGDIARKPHQPHYQSRDYNPLNGGIERWFEPVTEAIGRHPAMLAILRLCHATFHSLTPEPVRPEAWHVEAHQFRIEARPGEAGHPTPEGMHQDGVDWVLVLLVRRENVAQGETSIHDLQRQLIGNFTLAEPMDVALVNDSQCFHGVTPVLPLDPARPAWRDVLVVTFRRM